MTIQEKKIILDSINKEFVSNRNRFIGILALSLLPLVLLVFIKDYWASIMVVFYLITWLGVAWFYASKSKLPSEVRKEKVEALKANEEADFEIVANQKEFKKYFEI